MSDGIEHATDLSFAALVERHFHDRGATLPFANAHHTGLCGPARLAGKCQPFGELLIDFWGW